MRPTAEPVNDVADMIPVTSIPSALIVTPEPTTALVAVSTPALTMFLLSSIIVEPDILIASYRPRIHWVVLLQVFRQLLKFG